MAVFDSALIHLSDLECGVGNRAEELSYDDGYERCDQELIKDVEKLLKEHHVAHGRVGLVVTGDITAYGKADEFDKAAACISRIRRAFGMDNTAVAVVPGNHDVCWDDAWQEYSKRHPRIPTPDAAQRKEAWTYKEKLASFAKFYKDVTEGDFIHPETVVAYKGLTGLHAALIGFDTTVHCTFVPEDNVGLLRREPFEEGAGHLEEMTRRKPKLFKIAAMHHSPFPPREPPDTSHLEHDEMVRGWLVDKGFAVVLCGHEHGRAAVGLLDVGLQVLQVGSYGINRAKLAERYINDPNASNSYQILFMGPDGVGRCYFRSLREAGKAESEWIPDARGRRHRDYAEIHPSILEAHADHLTLVMGSPVRLATRPQVIVVSVALRGSSDAFSGLEWVEYVVPGLRPTTVKRGHPADNFRTEMAISLDEAKGRSIKARLHYEDREEQLAAKHIPAENPRWSLTPPDY